MLKRFGVQRKEDMPRTWRWIWRLAAVGMTALALGACGGSESSGSSTSSAASSGTSTGSSSADASASWVTTTPAGTGQLQTVTWDLPYGEPSSLDYTQAAAFSENGVLANLCEGLLRVDPDLSLQPSLAVSYTNPTPTTWIYQLRPNVHFTDGHLMTPADVVYSLERNMNPKIASFWGPWFTNVKTIAADGPDAVKVTLKRPDATFNQFLATAGGVVAEKAYMEKAGSSYGTAKGGVMCTGPFILKKWTPGSGIVTVRNPHYWDTSHEPKVAELDYKFITNPSTIADALNSGEIDGTYEVPISAVPALENSSVGKLYLGKSTLFALVQFTAKPGPVQDVRVREALSVMLDRAAIAKAIYHGTAIPISSAAFPTTWGYGQDVYRQAYDALPNLTNADMAKAKQLLAAAGKIRPLTVLLNADDVASQQMGIYFQSQAKQLGVDVQLVQLPAGQFIAASFDPKQQKEYDVLIDDSGYFDVPEPLEQALYGLMPGQPFNAFGYSNPTVTKELTEAQSTTDPDERATLVSAAWEQAQGKDWVLSPIVNYAERLFMNKRLTGAPAALPTYLYYPWGASLAGTG
jgi:peptide/nickel transport system substrate-binding protein